MLMLLLISIEEETENIKQSHSMWDIGYGS